jgi:hypothetical protein
MRLVFFLILVIAFNFCAYAQTAPAQYSESDVRALVERINKLEKRVAELEAKDSSTAAPAQAKETQSQSQAPPQSSITAPTAASASNKPGAQQEMAGMHQQVASEAESYPSLKIRGFADVDFAASDRAGTTSGFTLGQFVLHFASRLSNKVSYFGEVSLTAQPSLYNVDLERSIIRYDVNDAVKVSFGRYHTPINYWNTAFHHGAWLQTTISRPDMIRFGGTFEPVHFLGAQSEGNIPSGALNLGYNVGIGNGRGSILSRAGDNGDVNNNRAWLVNLYSRPTKFKNLQVGGSFYNDEISLTTTGVPLPEGAASKEWIAAGHLVWTGETPEFLAEFANVHHRSILTGHGFDSQGGYAQVAFRLPYWQKRWKPYYRYDYVQVPRGEPFFLSVDNVRGSTLGMRYDISDFAAFKAEYRNGRSASNSPVRANSVVVQTAFTF